MAKITVTKLGKAKLQKIEILQGVFNLLDEAIGVYSDLDYGGGFEEEVFNQLQRLAWRIEATVGVIEEEE